MSTILSTTYRTVDGDVLDAIAYRQMGSAAGVHTLLKANPGLAGIGGVLPAGIVVQIPSVPTITRKATVRLWSSGK